MTESSSRDRAEDSVVYIVDDDRSVREALKDLLASVSLPARSFDSVSAFLAFRLLDAPSCLVLDVRMPGQSGMNFLARMAQLDLHLPTILVTGHGDISMSVRAMKDGAIEFLAKPFRDQDLLDAIHRGIEMDRAYRAKRAVISDLRQRWGRLTTGEKDVARLVADGKINKQIAGELGLSEVTIKVRRNHLMAKLEVRTLVDLIRFLNLIS